jgi:gliding motility-associated-like protein
MQNQIKHLSTGMTLLLLCSICFIPRPAHSNHIMGSDLSWTCVDNLTFLITLKLYRDCKGADLTNNASIEVKCAENGRRMERLDLTRKSITDITPSCDQMASTCVNRSGEGIEEHTFTQLLDFNKSIYQTGCCLFSLEFRMCCRNGAITTGSSGKQFFTESLINLCNIKQSIQQGCDNSPEFRNVPTAYLCCNQLFTYNNGTFDADGDSLVFSLTPPLRGSGIDAHFDPPFHPQTWPMTAYCPSGVGPCPCRYDQTQSGFCFNERTGDITFIPVDCQEVGILAIKAEQYRLHQNGIDWLHIGTVRRDMQFKITPCSNKQPPTLFDAPMLSVCEGARACFTIRAEDKGFTDPSGTFILPDSIQLSWNNTLRGATFQVGPHFTEEKYGQQIAVREAEICWQTEEGDARNHAYHFSVTASDNTCPFKRLSSKGYPIKVSPINQCFDLKPMDVCYEAHYSDQPDGYKKIPIDSLLLIQLTPVSGNWSITSAPDDISPDNYQQYILDEGTEDQPYQLLDLRSRVLQTTEIWELTYCLDSIIHKKNHCKKTTITIGEKPEVTLTPIPPMCQQSSASIQLMDYTKPDGGRWQILSGPTTDYDILSPSYQMNLNSPYGTYTMQYVHDNTGCIVMDTTTFTLLPYPHFEFHATDTVGCEPFTLKLLANIMTPQDLSLDYMWTIENIEPIYTHTPYVERSLDHIGTYDITLRVVTEGLCTTTVHKTAYITVHPTPNAHFTATPKQLFTTAPILTITNLSSISEGHLHYLWFIENSTWSDTSHQNTPLIHFQHKDTGHYRIHLTAFTDEQCSDTHEEWISYFPKILLWIPNAFSPNKSGPLENEQIKPSVLGSLSFEFYIYNRWGEKLFETNQPEKGWDGTYMGNPCPAGTYLYIVKMKGIDEQWIEQKGSIQLIR